MYASQWRGIQISGSIYYEAPANAAVMDDLRNFVHLSLENVFMRNYSIRMISVRLLAEAYSIYFNMMEDFVLIIIQ